jgi:DNA-binding CsgD family transcriptional regulator
MWATRTAPASLAWFFTVDDRQMKLDGDVVFSRGPRAPELDLEAMVSEYGRRYQRSDPLSPRRLAAGGRSVVDLDDVIGRDQRSLSPYVSGFLGSRGIVGQTTILLRGGGRIIAGMDLLRGAQDPEPGLGEMMLLRAGHGLLQEAYAYMQQTSAPASGGPSPLVHGLTRRESDIALRVADGASNHEIARDLGISESTVKSHLVHVFEKLRIRSRTQLSLIMRQAPNDPSHSEELVGPQQDAGNGH